jgi:[protein-PII] uridylyltransferase
MAKVMSRSFLSSDEKLEFLRVCKSPEAADILQHKTLRSLVLDNSAFLEASLLKKLNELGDWQGCQPILLGSWARQELCPLSDLDVIFLGPDQKVLGFVEKVQEAGLRIRYRVPKDPKDWTVGVEPFDILALFGARALAKEGEEQLSLQRQSLQKNFKKIRKTLLRAVLVERKRRQKRLDSITNFLEPHIKYTPGGIRDIEQALALLQLYPEKTAGTEHALQILHFYKDFLLLVRQRLHAESSQDILAGAEQLEISKAFSFSGLSPFMKEVQRGLSRTFFYSEWLVESIKATQKKIQQVAKTPLKKPEDLMKALRKDPGILMQKKVRESLSDTFKRPAKKSRELALSAAQLRCVEQLLGPRSADSLVFATFNSRLIDKVLPAVKKLVGHVQHDQYHRFTADIHLQQACREFLKVRASSKELGPLAFLHKELSAKDWELVGWSCLFHDLSKGEGGDHSHKGAESVYKMLPRGFKSKSFQDDLSWMVENHLLLTSLAFKRSSMSSQTLKELQSHGVTTRRLQLLAVFTVIDIKATNPEAWTHWKGQLLRDFLMDLRSPDSLQRQKLLHVLETRFKKLPATTVDEFDSFLLHRIPVNTLVRDLESVYKVKEASLKIFKVAGRNWVRFFEPHDRPGLLTEYVDRLHQVGANVLHASVQTLPGVGVYDWFQVQLPRNKEKLLLHSKCGSGPVAKAIFEDLEITPMGSDDWMIRLKAKDQRGLLKYACYALGQAGANIKSARVHTWGLKVEDVFRIQFKGTEAELKSNITSFFGDFR